MTQPPHDEQTASSPAELREQVQQTRHELGQTVEALAARTDVKARVQEKTAEVRQQAAVKAGELRAMAADAAHQVQDRLPDPVKDTAAQAGRAARGNRTVLLLATAGVAVVWLASRRKKG
ncbi:DUF3618 domain-containing protein [Streptomyces sp. TP-A0356]|uniref:DUF3618 domain-containing protein n=1 Tax=Streptomyces sp. TP-A0356 TaxID=1359208 RepID=UPI0006E3C166|nr:DUF3618 domain-containing protein [Streptomyces sp. TP-A0356]